MRKYRSIRKYYMQGSRYNNCRHILLLQYICSTFELPNDQDMNLHEYQSKSILKQYGVAVPEGILAQTPEEAVKAAEIIQNSTGTDKWVIKAQVHAGGRGKAGGVKIAKNIDDVRNMAEQIIGMTLISPQTGPQGKKVRKVLVEQNIFYPGPSEPMEIYLSILLNRQKGHIILMYSTRGGMDIEK